MRQSYDVAIVGGAAMGSAVAYFLAARQEFDGDVLVVERDPSYADSATARSWGGVRQQFSTPENVLMSRFALDFLAQAQDLLAVDGDRPDFGFRDQGYLFLADDSGLETLAANVAMQTGLGADVSLLDSDGLAARFPWLTTDGIAAGGLGLSGEGWLDPHALLQALRRKARSLGVEYVTDTVTDIHRDGARVTGLRLASGGDVSAGAVVNAAGPAGGAVARMAGLDLPVYPRKRTTFVFDCRADLPAGAMPMTVDPSGLCFRPEGAQFIAILSPAPEDDPDCEDLVPDESAFEGVIWPTLARRVPAFEAIRLTSSWAGLYDVNTVDQNAILGSHPDVPNFYLCNGFSGHGLQQAPAAGRAIAELIVHGGFRTLDLSAFSFDRLSAGRSARERNVV